MPINFHTINRLAVGVLLILMGVIFIDTLMEWEYLFRYYGLGGWTTSKVLSRFVPAFIITQGVLVLTDRVQLWSTLFLLSIPLLFSFLLVTHPADDVFHYDASAFGSEIVLLLALLVSTGLSIIQSIPKRNPSRLMNILAIIGVVGAFATVGIVQPIFPEEYDDRSEHLPSEHFEKLDELDEETKVFALFGQGCIHCARAAQKLFLMHRETDKLDQLQFFFPGGKNDPEVQEYNDGFIDFTKAKADYATIDGRLFGQLNGTQIPGIYMRTDSNTFVAWRGGAFNMQAVETIEAALNR